jgi:hypothetical protein
MKKYRLVLGKPFMALLAVVLALGFVLVGCDDGTNNGGIQVGGGGTASRFTLTGIPAQYNGKYAYFQAQSGNYETGVQIWGFQSFNQTSANSVTITLCRISNGSVSIPAWNVDAAGYPPYTGNDYFTVYVGIYESQVKAIQSDFDDHIGVVGFLQVPFTNGSATKSWSEGVTQ